MAEFHIVKQSVFLTPHLQNVTKKKKAKNSKKKKNGWNINEGFSLPVLLEWFINSFSKYDLVVSAESSPP